MDDPRIEPPREGGEYATLAGFPQFQRDTLAVKCAGPTADQLREPAVPPSDLSLLGPVRHMVDVERMWLRNCFDGENVPTDTLRPEGCDFDVSSTDVDATFDAWDKECAHSRDLVDAAESLDVTGHTRRGKTVALRWILTHMIEEYARHNGHADLLRERIDGTTGE